jgi:hypothetical protein
MTFTEANELAVSLNNTLTSLGAAATVKYSVFPYWDSQYNKIYNVVLYPTARAGKYEAATDSQKLAFMRVSLKSQLAAPQSYVTFNTTFEANALLDTELNNYFK